MERYTRAYIENGMIGLRWLIYAKFKTYPTQVMKLARGTTSTTSRKLLFPWSSLVPCVSTMTTSAILNISDVRRIDR